MSRWQVRRTMIGGYRRHSPPPAPPMASSSSTGRVYHHYHSNGYYGRESDQESRYSQQHRSYDEDYYNDDEGDGYRQNGGGGGGRGGGRLVGHVPWRDYAYSNIYDSFDSAYSASASRGKHGQASTSGSAESYSYQHSYWRGSGGDGGSGSQYRREPRWDSFNNRYATYAKAGRPAASSRPPPPSAVAAASSSSLNCTGGRARMVVSSVSSGGGVGPNCLLETPGTASNSRRPAPRSKRPTESKPPALPSPIGSDVATPTGQYACRLCKFGTDDVYSLYVHANTGEHIARAVHDPAQSLCCRLCNLFAGDINDILYHHKVHENRPEAGSSNGSEGSSNVAAASAAPTPSEEAQPPADDSLVADADDNPAPSPVHSTEEASKEAPASPKTAPQRPLKLKIRCLPCRQAFSRQLDALAHFRQSTCQQNCQDWWRAQTAACGQPHTFFAVQCRSCAKKPTFPGFTDALESHIADEHPAQRPAAPSSDLLEHLAKVKDSLLIQRQEDGDSASLATPKPRQMARKSMPKPGVKRRHSAVAAAAKPAKKKATGAATTNNITNSSSINGVLAKRARMSVQPDSQPIVGSSCLMAPGYRPLLLATATSGTVARDAAKACAELDASGRLALVGPAGNGHAGLACLACGRLCADAAQFWVHSSACQRQQQQQPEQKLPGQQAGVCPLCSLEVADLDVHIGRHRRRMLPSCWRPGPKPQLTQLGNSDDNKTS